MPLHVCPGIFFILDSRLDIFFIFYFFLWGEGGGGGGGAGEGGGNCPFDFQLVVFDCGAVALSAFFFTFCVLDGRC